MSTEQPKPGRVDKTPAGSQHNAALPSGEVFSEYGVVDLNSNFPADSYEWQNEVPMDAPTQDHVIVPFRVVQRGIKQLKTAKKAAERLSEEGGDYKAVLLSDPRGL